MKYMFARDNHADKSCSCIQQQQQHQDIMALFENNIARGSVSISKIPIMHHINSDYKNCIQEFPSQSEKSVIIRNSIKERSCGSTCEKQKTYHSDRSNLNCNNFYQPSTNSKNIPNKIELKSDAPLPSLSTKHKGGGKKCKKLLNVAIQTESPIQVDGVMQTDKVAMTEKYAQTTLLITGREASVKIKNEYVGKLSGPAIYKKDIAKTKVMSKMNNISCTATTDDQLVESGKGEIMNIKKQGIHQVVCGHSKSEPSIKCLDIRDQWKSKSASCVNENVNGKQCLHSKPCRYHCSLPPGSDDIGWSQRNKHLQSPFFLSQAGDTVCNILWESSQYVPSNMNMTQPVSNKDEVKGLNQTESQEIKTIEEYTSDDETYTTTCSTISRPCYKRQKLTDSSFYDGLFSLLEKFVSNEDISTEEENAYKNLVEETFCSDSEDEIYSSTTEDIESTLLTVPHINEEAVSILPTVPHINEKQDCILANRPKLTAVRNMYNNKVYTHYIQGTSNKTYSTTTKPTPPPVSKHNSTPNNRSKLILVKKTNTVHTQQISKTSNKNCTTTRDKRATLSYLSKATQTSTINKQGSIPMNTHKITPEIREIKISTENITESTQEYRSLTPSIPVTKKTVQHLKQDIHEETANENRNCKLKEHHKNEASKKPKETKGSQDLPRDVCVGTKIRERPYTIHISKSDETQLRQIAAALFNEVNSKRLSMNNVSLTNKDIKQQNIVEEVVGDFNHKSSMIKEQKNVEYRQKNELNVEHFFHCKDSRKKPNETNESVNSQKNNSPHTIIRDHVTNDSGSRRPTNYPSRIIKQEKPKETTTASREVNHTVKKKELPLPSTRHSKFAHLQNIMDDISSENDSKSCSTSSFSLDQCKPSNRPKESTKTDKPVQKNKFQELLEQIQEVLGQK